jgi:hypothetical protein
MTTEEIRIVNFLTSMPGLAHSTVKRKQLQSILLSTGGQIMCNGRLYEITQKHLGGGVYRISTSRWQDCPLSKEASDGKE